MDTWVSETLSDAGQEALFKAARERQAATEVDRSERRTLGFWVGAAGMVVAVGAIAALVVIASKQPQERPEKYTLIDKASGAIAPAVDAKDAPLLYPESVRRAELRALIIACEGYVPQSWAKMDFHLCMIRLTPGEQKRRNLDIGVDGPRYPPKSFGSLGYAMPTDFPLGAFVLLGTTGTAPNEIYHYTVRYERTEIVNSVETHARYSADVVFTFRPDLKINAPDALANPGRMQVESFSTIRDRT